MRRGRRRPNTRVGGSALRVVAVGDRPRVGRRAGGGAVGGQAPRDIVDARGVGSGRRVTDRRIGRGDRRASVVGSKWRDSRIDRHGVVDTSFNGFALVWCDGARGRRLRCRRGGRTSVRTVTTTSVRRKCAARDSNQ